MGSNAIALPANLRLGDHMYEDMNKDGKLTQDDLVFLDSDDPKYSFSFNFGCEWKGFDFNTVFQGVGKRTIDVYKRQLLFISFAGRNQSCKRADSYYFKGDSQ